MTNSCQLISTEYTRNYKKWRQIRTKPILQTDDLTGRIEEGEIDPRTASIPSQLDEAAEQLVQKDILNRLRTVYQICYKHPRPGSAEETMFKENDLQCELLGHIHDLYFNPHTEKVLAPPVTQKRLLGYIRPKLLHGSFSTYQDTFGRTAATVIIKEHEKKSAIISESGTIPEGKNESSVKQSDPCVNFDLEAK